MHDHSTNKNSYCRLCKNNSHIFREFENEKSILLEESNWEKSHFIKKYWFGHPLPILGGTSFYVQKQKPVSFDINRCFMTL